MRLRIVAVALLALTMLIIPSLVHADTFIKTATHTDAMKMGPQTTPAVDDTSITWMGDNMAAMIKDEASSMIINGETGMIYNINHKDKSYTEMSMDALGDIEKMMEGSGADKTEAAMFGQQMKAMMAAMKMEAKVTPTEETKDIHGWNCKKFIVEIKMGMGGMTNNSWVTKDVEIDYTIFSRLMSAPMMQMPGFQELMAEMEKMGGIPVLVEGSMNMMGTEVKSKQEVLAIETKDAPEGTYDVPKDYKKEKFEPKMGM
ncbi:MAG: DUF4412 domain-containing protein [Candidatus Zixiibacteriota bacterium]